MHKFSIFTVGGGPIEKEKEPLPDVCQRWAGGSLTCKDKIFTGIID